MKNKRYVHEWPGSFWAVNTLYVRYFGIPHFSFQHIDQGTKRPPFLTTWQVTFMKSVFYVFIFPPDSWKSNLKLLTFQKITRVSNTKATMGLNNALK